MIEPRNFHDCLQEEGIEFATGVPDSLLNDFCLYLSAELPSARHVVAANEGNAIALAAGHHLATGKVPLVYMQNSGLGNATNPLLSLTNAEVYGIPMLLLIGWRGEPGTLDHAHHQKQGAVTREMLSLMDIPYRILEDDLASAREVVGWAARTADERQSPTALLVRKGVLARGMKSEKPSESALSLSREEAMGRVMDCMPGDTIFVATTGRATREIHDLREQRGLDHNRDFLNVGAMGHGSSIALGIVLGTPDRPVVCLDGDAAVIMHLGTLATIGALGPPNFMHVILNNGAHESVGGQPSAGFKINLTGMAENAGYATVGQAITRGADLEDALRHLAATGKPGFIDVHVRKGIRLDLSRRVSHEGVKDRLICSLKRGS